MHSFAKAIFCFLPSSRSSLLPKITLHLLHLFITDDARALELSLFLLLLFPGKPITGGFFDKSLETVRVLVLFRTSFVGISKGKLSDSATVDDEHMVPENCGAYVHQFKFLLFVSK